MFNVSHCTQHYLQHPRHFQGGTARCFFSRPFHTFTLHVGQFFVIFKKNFRNQRIVLQNSSSLRSRVSSSNDNYNIWKVLCRSIKKEEVLSTSSVILINLHHHRKQNDHFPRWLLKQLTSSLIWNWNSGKITRESVVPFFSAHTLGASSAAANSTGIRLIGLSSVHSLPLFTTTTLQLVFVCVLVLHNFATTKIVKRLREGSGGEEAS